MNEKIYCKDCRFYESRGCHRMPPTLVFNGNEGATGYPQVNSYDWCGAAEKKEDATDPTNPADGIFVSTIKNGKDDIRVNGMPMETFLLSLHQKAKDL